MSAIQVPVAVTGCEQGEGDRVPLCHAVWTSSGASVTTFEDQPPVPKPPVPKAPQPSAQREERAEEVERVDPVAVRRITPFFRPQINPDQLPPDYLALLSLTFGVAGLMLKSTWASWVSVFCCVSSLGNMKANETDPKQIGCSVLFACMGLFMNYFGPGRTRPIA